MHGLCTGCAWVVHISFCYSPAAIDRCYSPSLAETSSFTAFGLALLVRDGLLMLVALGFSILSLALDADLLTAGGLFGGEGGDNSQS